VYVSSAKNVAKDHQHVWAYRSAGDAARAATTLRPQGPDPHLPCWELPRLGNPQLRHGAASGNRTPDLLITSVGRQGRYLSKLADESGFNVRARPRASPLALLGCHSVRHSGDVHAVRPTDLRVLWIRKRGETQDERGGSGIPSRRRACLGAGQGQASRWSTACDERPGRLPLVCYVLGADVTGYRRHLGDTTFMASPGTIPERRPAGGTSALITSLEQLDSGRIEP
jgi:hypothetical protein